MVDACAQRESSSSSSSYMVIAALVMTLVIGAVCQEPLCPDKCQCVATTITCTAKELTKPPPGSWPPTTALNMRNNIISELHKGSLSGFPLLTTFDIIGNALVELDFEIFADTPDLLNLYLEDNRIQTVAALAAESKVFLEKLLYIYLTNNFISSLDPDLFAKIAPNLLYLGLGGNPLVVQDGAPVLNHPRLRNLKLRGASRLHAGPGSFSGLPNLKIVLMANSSITEVTEGAFANTGSIMHLSLNDNPLVRLDLSAIDKALGDGGVVDIDSSPMACSCDYEGLYYWSKQNGKVLYAYCKGVNDCSFPPRTIN